MNRYIRRSGRNPSGEKQQNRFRCCFMFLIPIWFDLSVIFPVYDGKFRLNCVSVQWHWATFSVLLTIPSETEQHINLFISLSLCINSIENICQTLTPSDRIASSSSGNKMNERATREKDYKLLSMRFETKSDRMRCRQRTEHKQTVFSTQFSSISLLFLLLTFVSILRAFETLSTLWEIIELPLGVSSLTFSLGIRLSTPASFKSISMAFLVVRKQSLEINECGVDNGGSCVENYLTRQRFQ